MRLLCSSLVALALTACSTGGAGPQPKSSVHLVRFDLAADPTTLNPLFAHADAAVIEQQLAHLSFEPFFDLDAHGRPVPELITKLPTVADGGISRDGRTLTYHLRPNVVWSDGVALTSRDVLFTVHAILDPRNPVASREGYDLIDSVQAPDASTVRFHLKHAWAPAVATLFAYGTSPQYVLPEHVLGKQGPIATSAFNAAPTVGDGPFVFRTWKRGERLMYVANPRYWRGKPKVDRIDIRIVPDPGTNLTLLQSGAVDFNLIAPAQQRALASVSGIAYRYVPTALIVGIALNLAHPPLDDVRVRRAIAQSIDRFAISEKITFGKYPVVNADRPRYSWAYDSSIAQPRYDPAAADAAFDAAGWQRGAGGIRRKNGAALALTYVQFPESATGVRVATMVQGELRERGVELSIKSISNAQLFAPAGDGGILASGMFDMAYVPWQMGADPDDAFLVSCLHASKNYMRYCNPAVDRLETQAVNEPEQAQRRSLYARSDALVAQDLPVLYLYNPEYIYAYRKSLQGFSPNAFSPTWNAYAWVRSSECEGARTPPC